MQITFFILDGEIHFFLCKRVQIINKCAIIVVESGYKW